MAGIDAVRAYCGWQVAPPTSETFEVEGDGGRVLLLPSLHVTDVAEVRDESGDVVDSDCYKWRRNGILRGRWCREELYAVDVTHGYAEMPPELQDIIDGIDADGMTFGTLTSKADGPFSESYALESAPLSVRSILDRYKLPPRP